MSVEIKCINKSDRQNAHERIKNVGGVNPGGGSWKLTETDAIAGIENGKWSFWTKGGGQMTDVIIATHNGRKYLKTKADTTTKDNLLSLPECP
jgi:hypothetical protein